ncbi:MAG: glycosyltransferase [Muribaculaceae bacterium]|nr:glycosyltransferase [Muribaculaceae bacterium]
MNRPEISIIVPVYRVESYLPACIESVLAQTFRNWELILVDDGSPDNCGAICDSYAARDSRIKVLHQSNAGVSAARNTGLEARRGSMLTFLDGDDMIAPLYLQRLLEVMKRTGCDISGCGEIMFSGTPANMPSVPRQPIEEYSGQQAYELMLYRTGRLNSSVWGKLYRSSLWDTVRYTPGLWYEDLEVSARIFLKARNIAYTPEPLYLYRQHGGSFLHTFRAERLHVLRAVAAVADEVAHSYPALLPAAYDRMLSANLNMVGLMAVNGYDDHDTEQTCWQTVKRLRRATLFNSKARMRNRLTALLTYIGGLPLYRFAARHFYPRDSEA